MTASPFTRAAALSGGWPPDWARGLAEGVEIDPGLVHLALEAGGWGTLSAPERRAFALIVLASLDAQSDGATRLPLAALPARLRRLAATADDQAAAAALVARLAEHPGLAGLVGRPGDYRPFIVDGSCLYHEREHRLETSVAAKLAGRLDVRPFELPAAWRPPAPPAGRSWTARQAEAIGAGLRRRLTVVSGGPGTGKTALIDGIVRAWTAVGIPRERIAIAAPTGKAANRIGELLGPDAPAPLTLHRLLGHGSGRPTTRGSGLRHHENRPLPHAAVIVDEASMVGLALMDRLLRALAADTRLVLIGDADQLPAVESGSVFRDLAALESIRLVESHRMNPADPAGAAVLDAAGAIVAGALGERGRPALRHPNELPFAGFSCLDRDGASPGEQRRLLEAFLGFWFETWLHPDRHATVAEGGRRTFQSREGILVGDEAERAAAILDHHRRVRLLTLTRRGPTGAGRANELLGRRLAEALNEGWAPAELPAGTPVMMTHNDYERGLFNGDQGVVLRVVGERGVPERAAVFPRAGALVAFPLATLGGALETAYASTVHKAQGSELDHAALLLPAEGATPATGALLTRELVYTAVTRVRRSITVVGPRALLDRAVAQPLERASGLADRLAAARRSDGSTG